MVMKILFYLILSGNVARLIADVKNFEEWYIDIF